MVVEKLLDMGITRLVKLSHNDNHGAEQVCIYFSWF